MTADLPRLPYAGTSGWSGSDTSRERADREDNDGTTGTRQHNVLVLLDRRGEHGVTWLELANSSGLHHGQASSALSGLHKDGLICRLTERRDRCQVYVLPEHVAGRETRPHGRKRPTLTDEEADLLKRLDRAVVLAAMHDRGMIAVPLDAARTLSDALHRLA